MSAAGLVSDVLRLGIIEMRGYISFLAMLIPTLLCSYDYGHA